MLLVGLGNPGPTYAATRHNAGFMVLDLLAERVGATFKAHRGRADVIEASWPGPNGVRHPVVLMKPKCFMNESGGPVASLHNFFKIPVPQVVVVHDELDLPFGTLRLKLGGGPGGHNGLKSISGSLGSANYGRVRFGIGRPPGRMDPAAFVLKSFAAAEAKELPLLVDRAADAVESIILEGLERSQNRFHTDLP